MATTPQAVRSEAGQEPKLPPREGAVPCETERDLEFPRREAAFFYGLFLRGHSADELRRDIEVPAQVLDKWHREAEREPGMRDLFARMVEYRRHVLAIFDSLVSAQGLPQRVQ